MNISSYLKTKPKQLTPQDKACSKREYLIQKHNNQKFLEGYLCLHYSPTEIEKEKIYKKISEFEKAYRGAEGQKGGYDSLVRLECEKLGFSVEQIRAESKREDFQKKAANDEVKSPIVDMFANAKQIKQP